MHTFLLAVMMALAGSASAESVEVDIPLTKFFPVESVQPTFWPPKVTVGPMIEGDIPCEPGPGSKHQDHERWIVGNRACSHVAPGQGGGESITNVTYVVATIDKTVTIEWAFTKERCPIYVDGVSNEDPCFEESLRWDVEYVADEIAKAVMTEEFGVTAQRYPLGSAAPGFSGATVTGDFRKTTLRFTGTQKEVEMFYEVVTDMKSEWGTMPVFPEDGVATIDAPLELLRKFRTRGSDGFTLRLFACPSNRPDFSVASYGFGIVEQYCEPPIELPLAYDPRQPFSDVPSDHPYAEAIESLYDDGTLTGYEDGTFKPDSTINRAEFLKIVLGNPRVIEDEDADPPPMFDDVPWDSWFGPYVYKARHYGIVDGYPDGTFRPGNTITFPEAAKIIMRESTIQLSAMLEYLSSEATPASEDAKPTRSGPWYEQFILALADQNAIPMSITSLEQRITRGEMAEIIYRLHHQEEKKPSMPFEQFLDDGTRTFCNPAYGFCFDHDASVLVKVGQFPEEFYSGLGGAIPNFKAMARTILVEDLNVETDDVDAWIGEKSMGYQVMINVLDYSPELYAAIQKVQAEDLHCREDGTRCSFCEIKPVGKREIAGQTVDLYAPISKTKRCDANGYCTELCEDTLYRSTAAYMSGHILMITTVGTQRLYDVYDEILDTLRAEP